MEILTLEIIKNWNLDVEDTFENIDGFNMEYPKRDNKPFLPKIHSLEEVQKYAEDLKIYESESYVDYVTAKNIYEERKKFLNNLKEEFIKDYSGFNDTVPSQYKNNVWSYAWQHSDGWSNVCYELEELVSIFS